MQFVAIKPSVLHATAVEQLKKAEEIRKATVKEVTRKEEPEDWQNVSFYTRSWARTFINFVFFRFLAFHLERWPAFLSLNRRLRAR